MGGVPVPCPKIGQSGKALKVRHIILSDDGFHVAEDAYHRLFSVCYFPESPRDQAQALFIAKLERDEFQRVSEDQYKPSEIMQVAAQLVEKRTTQLYSVGLVAISFLWLKHSGFKPSLNRASIIASRSACEFGKITWRSSIRPKDHDKVKPVTGDAATVERLFRRYRSVAHICAARVSAGGYLEQVHLWDQTPEVTGAMIQTTASFQDALERATDVSSWNLWDVRRHFPAELGEAPVLVPDDDLLYWVERGYSLALKEGMIKRLDGGR